MPDTQVTREWGKERPMGIRTQTYCGTETQAPNWLSGELLNQAELPMLTLTYVGGEATRSIYLYTHIQRKQDT